MQPARFRQADISLVKINNAKSMSPAVSSGRSAGSFPEQRLVIEPTRRIARNKYCRVHRQIKYCSTELLDKPGICEAKKTRQTHHWDTWAHIFCPDYPQLIDSNLRWTSLDGTLERKTWLLLLRAHTATVHYTYTKYQIFFEISDIK